MNPNTEYAILILTQAIEGGALRLTEINNKLQVVAKGGVRRVEDRESRRWIERTMVKRDNAEIAQRALHIARKELRRLSAVIDSQQTVAEELPW